MHLNYRQLLPCATLVLLGSAAFAQTCQSLITTVEQTLDQTQSLTQQTSVKAGAMDVMSSTTTVTKTADGLKVALVERSGMTPPGGADAGVLGGSWLGPVDLAGFGCKGHALSVLEDGRYRLELVAESDDAPAERLTLEIQREGEHALVERVDAQGMKAPGMPMEVDTTTVLSDWLLEE